MIFEQSTGKLYQEDGTFIAAGYAGRDEDGIQGKNNPEAQTIKGYGPLPVGTYTLNPPANDPTVGAYAMRLTPDPSNEMFGRNSFFMHGDSVEHPGLASHGCIVMPRNIREAAWAGEDHTIHVVANIGE